jgi:hypothetical protein
MPTSPYTPTLREDLRRPVTRRGGRAGGGEAESRYARAVPDARLDPYAG